MHDMHRVFSEDQLSLESFDRLCALLNQATVSRLNGILTVLCGWLV
jgi:hypothetical protein